MPENLLGWLGGMTLWTAALLVVAAIADRLLARRVRPAWRVLLYCTVFVRLALPVDWQSPIGLVPVVEPSVVDTAPARSVVVNDRAVMPEVPPPNTGWTLAELVAVGWGGGTIVLLAMLVAARIRLSRRLATAAPARAGVVALACGADIREHDSEGPLTFGVLRSTIVLPRALVDAASEEALHHVVAHELAHVQRRDPAFALALSLAVACAWPVLPVWFAAARIRQLVEQAADDHCLTHGGVGSARAYGRTLLALAQRRPSMAAAVLRLGGFRDLRGRIAALTERRRAAPSIQVAAIASISIAAVACSGVDSDPEAIAQRCAALVVEATTLHDVSEQTHDATNRLAAAEVYDAYARECAAQPDYGDVLYYRAELRWAIAFDRHHAGDVAGARAAFGEAHAAFNEALDGEPARFTKEAATGQVVAKRNELGVDVALPQRRNTASAPSEYTPDELEILAAYATYEQHVGDPDDEELLKIHYHRAELALRHDRFDEARPLLVELAKTPPGTELHDWAQDLLDHLDATRTD